MPSEGWNGGSHQAASIGLSRPSLLARAATEQIESLPAVFRGSGSTRTLRQARLNYFLSRILEFFPDRLATAKWRGRFKTTGLHHLEDARKRKHRVVLVCFHFGTYKLIPFWLRALGVPVIALIGGKSADRSRVKWMKDQLSPFPGMPTVLCIGDQLRKTVEHLSAGQVLLVAADRETNKQIDVRIDEQWSFSMATGAMRLAAHCNAELIPCSMRDEGRWNFRLEIGPPISKRISHQRIGPSERRTTPAPDNASASSSTSGRLCELSA